MHPPRAAAAPRAYRITDPRTSPDAQPRPAHLDILDHDPGQMRQQHPQIRQAAPGGAHATPPVPASAMIRAGMAR